MSEDSKKGFKKTTIVLGAFGWGEEYDALRQAVGFTPDCCHEASDLSEAIGRVREARVHGRTLFIKVLNFDMAMWITGSILPVSRNGKVQCANAVKYLQAGQAVKIIYPASSHKARVVVDPIEFPRSAPVATSSQQSEKLAA